MIDQLFEDMIRPTTAPPQQDVKYINCVPKIQITPYANISTNKNILLVPIDELEYIKSIQSNIQTLNKSKHLFYINPYNLSILINDIINTNGKYVYPMAHVNYLKNTLCVSDKVNFNNETLLYLRIWSNQIREIANKHNITNYKYTPAFLTASSETNHFHDITYIGYRICCELIHYYKYAHGH